MRIRFQDAFNQEAYFQFFMGAVFLTAIMLFSGCSRSTEEALVVPPVTKPLNRDYIGYAVVNASFAHLLNEPGGVSQAYLRRGTVIRILERRIEKANLETWIFVEGNYQDGGDISRGWLEEAIVDVFDNEVKAITASKSMNL